MITKPRRVSYLGVPAEVKELPVPGQPGVREVRTRWLADSGSRNGNHSAGTVVSRTISGDFTRGTGVMLVEDHVVAEF